jgi:exopolyphosphatase/guanosine-5'-triphosphate,3'-diphosphate pyrophosphatase
MQRLAAIEIGTHSIRMLIAEKDNVKLKEIFRKRVVTRLGENFFSDKTGTLKPEPVKRSLLSLREFFEIADHFGIPSPLIVATGVVREANNRDSFISVIRSDFEQNVEIISGEKEAYLTYKGVLSSLNNEMKNSLIFDLGGGSTEFIWVHNNTEKFLSLELGSVILTERFLLNDPPTMSEINTLMNYIDDILNSKIHLLRSTEDDTFSIVGTGGTTATLCKIAGYSKESDFSRSNTKNPLLSRKDIDLISKKLNEMTAQKRLNIKGVEKGREDTILSGALLIMSIIDYFKKNEILVSYSDILEGILIEHIGD